MTARVCWGVDDDKRRAILARRAEGQSLREIARGVGVSLAMVHGEMKAAETCAPASVLTTKPQVSHIRPIFGGCYGDPRHHVGIWWR